METVCYFLKEQLPGQDFTGYNVSEQSGLAHIGYMLMGMLTPLRDAFKDSTNVF